MSDMSDFLENKVLTLTLDNDTWSQVSTAYLALFESTGPGEDNSGTANETSYTNYARQAISVGSPSNGAIANNAEIEFPSVGDASGPYTITWVAVYDAATNGNLLFLKQLPSSQDLDENDSIKFTVGNLTFTAT